MLCAPVNRKGSRNPDVTREIGWRLALEYDIEHIVASLNSAAQN